MVTKLAIGLVGLLSLVMGVATYALNDGTVAPGWFLVGAVAFVIAGGGSLLRSDDGDALDADA